MITIQYKLLGEDKEQIFTSAISVKEDTTYLQMEEHIKEDLFSNEDRTMLKETGINTYQEHYEYYTEDLGYELVIII